MVVVSNQDAGVRYAGWTQACRLLVHGGTIEREPQNEDLVTVKQEERRSLQFLQEQEALLSSPGLLSVTFDCILSLWF